MNSIHAPCGLLFDTVNRTGSAAGLITFVHVDITPGPSGWLSDTLAHFCFVSTESA